jgi:HAD superfamily hydrolase (TIGR01459 family)
MNLFYVLGSMSSTQSCAKTRSTDIPEALPIATTNEAKLAHLKDTQVTLFIDTLFIDTLESICDDFDVAVIDQWGVLHNGTEPYARAADALDLLSRFGKQVLVLSNSGKRSDVNLKRIESIGLPIGNISKVVTSGEALWEDFNDGRLQIAGKPSSKASPFRIFPICGERGDPIDWASGSERLEIVYELDESVAAIMLMGLKDGTRNDAYDEVFERALELRLPLICSNPDKTSVRSGGLVISPGALADRYAEMGGDVVWYGKPHSPMFQAVSRIFSDLDADRFLMVGDSLEHDIAGAQQAGFKSAFIRGGIHTGDFANAASEETMLQTLDKLVSRHNILAPTYSLEVLA